jgi:hypothetical protein
MLGCCAVRARFLAWFWGSLALGMALVPGGCAADAVRVRSVDQALVDAPRLSCEVYTSVDRNTADVFLTDLDPAALEPGEELGRLSGRIVQIHMFLEPRAGSTPIAPTACSVVVRHLVLAGGEMGVYSGGGFLLPSGRAGKASLGGKIEGATLRLTGRTRGFADRLGPATMDASFSARRDEATSRRIEAVVNEILSRVGPAEGSATPVSAP